MVADCLARPDPRSAADAARRHLYTTQRTRDRTQPNARRDGSHSGAGPADSRKCRIGGVGTTHVEHVETWRLLFEWLRGHDAFPIIATALAAPGTSTSGTPRGQRARHSWAACHGPRDARRRPRHVLCAPLRRPASPATRAAYTIAASHTEATCATRSGAEWARIALPREARTRCPVAGTNSTPLAQPRGITRSGAGSRHV